MCVFRCVSLVFGASHFLSKLLFKRCPPGSFVSQVRRQCHAGDEVEVGGERTEVGRTPSAGEVARLQQMVSDLQRQLHQGLPVPPTVSLFRVRKREDHVPASKHEVMEWMADRREETNAAFVSGNPMEAARISGLIADSTKSFLRQRCFRPW